MCRDGPMKITNTSGERSRSSGRDSNAGHHEYEFITTKSGKKVRHFLIGKNRREVKVKPKTLEDG